MIQSFDQAIPITVQKGSYQVNLSG